MSKADELQYITFKQFVYTINIRDCYGDNICDNQVIRLVYDTTQEGNYIDLGWYDYYNKEAVWNILQKILNKNILESIVTDFRYDDKFNCITVYLENKDNVESLIEYKNRGG